LTETICVTAKGILFDMDGVLVSSIGSVVRSWRRWAKLYDLPNPETLSKRCCLTSIRRKRCG
jgi:mannitol-1-/sugar-/sorbitol-6-phosphatase